MLTTTNRSFQALGLALALSAAFTIHGTMLWGFEGVAAQAAASCAARASQTAIATPASAKPDVAPPGDINDQSPKARAQRQTPA